MKCQHYVVTHDYNAIYGGIFLPPPPQPKLDITYVNIRYHTCKTLLLGYVSTSEIGT